MKVKVYKQSGAAAGEMELNDSVFGADVNEALIHQTAVAQAANARQGTKCTLTRAEVRGGGIKPWRQKGTGRARQGSIRSPQWDGGGVVFAPKPRDFDKKVNKQSRRAATRSALSCKVRDDEFIVVDGIASTGKTKEIAKMLAALKIDDKSVLLVLTGKDGLVVRAAGNINRLTTITSEYVNVLDIVRNTKLVVTKEAVKAIEAAYDVGDIKKVEKADRKETSKAAVAKPAIKETKPVSAKPEKPKAEKAATVAKPKATAIAKPKAEKPVAEKVAVEKPKATEKPKAEKASTTVKPNTEKSAVAKPKANKPATVKVTTTAKAKTERPATEKPKTSAAKSKAAKKEVE